MMARAFPRPAKLLVLGPAVTLVGGFFLLPLVRVLQISFYQSTGGFRFVPAFVLDNYVRLLSDSYYIRVFGASLALATAVTVVAAVLGYPLAYLMTHKGGRLRTGLMALLVIALWVPIIVTVYGAYLTLSSTGLVNWLLGSLGLVSTPLPLTHNFWAIVFGMTGWAIPYMVLPLYTVVRGINPRIEEASRALGAGPGRTFWEITFPLSLPGLAAGVVLVWTWAIGEYVAPVILGGGTVRVISQELAVSFLQRLDWPFGSATCIALLVPIGLVVWLLGRYAGKEGPLK